MLDLRKLFVDVFDPQAGESAVILIDLPHDGIDDTAPWQTRRDMATRWHSALTALGCERGFEVAPLVELQATGANNAELPAETIKSGASVRLEEILGSTTLVLAMTEFSASAPLIDWIRKFPQLRAASLPRVAPEMEATGLAADYTQVARSCERLGERLRAATIADIEFSNGDRFRFDFRFRQPEVDDGRLHADASPPRLINLPSGEAFVAAYEGERGSPSLTGGILPVPWDAETVRLKVVANRVEEVFGDTAAARDLRGFLFTDRARCNVAELGLGCNPKARVWGNVLEDEKAGPHIALGRSEHLGGSVGPEAFANPLHVWHEDFVYARGCPIGISQLALSTEHGTREVLFANGSYAPDLKIGI
jgi:hypothetical protein